LGKYHPHGDGSVYDAMVRLAQEWNMRYPLVDKQGNFGSVEGDGPAAMRYTEARLSRIADEIMSDIKKETVDFQFNFDDSLEEPTVLPARFPNLLVNGASGIAVGMATNMLPHNLTEVCNGVIATIENPAITTDELTQYVKGPDFPTGGVIYGLDGIKEAHETGRGKIVLRGRAEIQTTNGRDSIVITEIPYQINQQFLEIKIKEAVESEKIVGISSIRNLSDRHGIRIVLDLKSDAIGRVVISQLYKFTPLQTSYGVNNVVLVGGRPMIQNVKQLIQEFIKFRLEVILKRAEYDLRKAEERAHILEGILIALDNLDAVIALIRASKTVDIAREGLMATFNLSEIQAKAILEMRLMRLTGLEIDKVQAEYNELQEKIKDLTDIIGSEARRNTILKDEMAEMITNYGDERRTEILHADGEIAIEDMIPNDQVVITISHLGYVKRTRSDEFRAQGRGGRGAKGSRTRDADFVEHILIGDNHNYLMFFTEQGRCFWLRVYELPEASKASAGRVIQNIISLPKDDNVKAYILVEDLTDKEVLENHFIMFCTKKGIVKKTSLEAFSRPRTNGINAITINEGDMLLEAKLTNGNSEIILANLGGRAIRFNESNVRSMGRSAAGVKGMTLANDADEVIGMVCIDPTDENTSIFVVSEKGYGKRSALEDYRITNRGGKGVKTLSVTNKTGSLIAIKQITDEDDLMVTTKQGIVLRLEAHDFRVMGRATQGVKVINLDANDDIADLAVLLNARRDSDEEE
jgi:DNA gyrase subunit A